VFKALSWSADHRRERDIVGCSFHLSRDLFIYSLTSSEEMGEKKSKFSIEKNNFKVKIFFFLNRNLGEGRVIFGT
jgi:hypothetical protein